MNEEITTEEKYWENGTLQYRINYKNGKRHGLYEWWFENGTLIYRYNYKNGKRHGLCEWWYSGLWRRYNYKNDKRHGLCEIFTPDGNIIFRKYYFNDEEVTEFEYDVLEASEES